MAGDIPLGFRLNGGAAVREGAAGKKLVFTSRFSQYS
jgi:hypothetical protein